MSGPYRYDRAGERVDADDQTADDQHRCRGGWLDDAWDGRPVPCPTCKPHLIRYRDDLSRALYGQRP